MYMENIEIVENYLKKSYMTRSTEKLKKVNYVVIHSAYEKNSNIEKEIARINSLSYQDEKYYSVHYIIGIDGECVNIVPEGEVTYSTNNIELNYYIISIECCIEKETGEFSKKTIKKLVQLLYYLKHKYNLSNSDILLHYDITGTRCPKFYVDNKFKFYDILDKVNKMEK